MLQDFIKTDYKTYEELYSNFKINIPDNFNFAFDIVDETASRKPDSTAMVWCDEKGDYAKFTFSDMKKMSNKTANFFKSIGIKKGDKVMLILKRRYEFWFCILALHKIGAVAIPATHLLTKKDIVYRNNAADIKMIVTVGDEDVINRVDESLDASPTLKLRVNLGIQKSGWFIFGREIEKYSDSFDRPKGDEATVNTDPLLLYFTSGTTGMPKMVKHNYTYPLGHILTARYWQNLKEDGLHLTVADTGWAKAAWGKIYGQWICECGVFVYDYNRFVPKDMLDVITKHGVTSFCAPPTIFRYLIKEDLTKFDFSKLKYCTVAGEPLNPEVYQQFLNMTGLKLMEGYGQTELVVTIATFPWMEPKPGSMGKPMPSYDIELLNDEGKICEVGEEGELVINLSRRKPYGMFEGYHKDPELTKRVWYDNKYHTGDMAWRDEDGYYWFVGRSDDLIKSSGYRIGPFEVESALLEHPAVLECAITAVPDPEKGQIVKATVVLAKGYTAGDELVKELQEHVKKVTAPYKYPRIIEFVTELPKTISGKIRRVEIRDNEKK
jgi:acetyl-CoA synthetase